MFAWKEMFCKSAKFLVKNEKESVILPERLSYWIERNFSKMGMAEDGTMVELSKQPEASRKFIIGHPNANFAVVRDQKSQWLLLNCNLIFNCVCVAYVVSDLLIHPICFILCLC